MGMEHAKEMFIHELGDMLDAENKVLTALQRMEKKLTDDTLIELIREHAGETEEQITRLEQIFKDLGEKPKRQPCKGMNGLIEEFNTFVKDEKPEDEILDVFAAGASMKVEHYEISSYETMISMAQQLGLEEAANALQQSLEEERNALRRLQEIAQDLLSQLPADEEEVEEEEEEVSGGKRGRSR
jgi:ferritin-like metal-binding protein YciE